MSMAKLHTREIIDYEKSCRPVCSAIITSPEKLAVGDHVHWKHWGSWRDGIIADISIRGTVARVTLYRYGHVFGSGMVLGQEVFNINCRKDAVYTYDYGEHCHAPAVVLVRARACFDQRGYNALRNNNEDFCRWCKSGKHTYLCINETFLCPDTDESTRGDDDVHCVVVTSLDAINQGDHISWLELYLNTATEDQGWRHGIVIDVDQKHADVVSFADTSHSLNVVKFMQLDFVDHKVHRYVYERCHMPDDVIHRARSQIGKLIFPEALKLFARWCKLGVPSDSDSVDKRVISTVSRDDPDEDEDKVNFKKEAGIAGARSAATGTARVVEGVAAKVALETAAKQGPRVLVRGAAEGAAAAAAVGVEAIVLGVDVGLTYRSFSRKEITKDELHRQNIQNSVRSASAAAASVGGGAAGAAIGTIIFPGAGTIVGGIIGGIVGGLTGQAGGHFAGKGIAYVARRPYENIFVEDGVDIVDD